MWRNFLDKKIESEREVKLITQNLGRKGQKNIHFMNMYMYIIHMSKRKFSKQELCWINLCFDGLTKNAPTRNPKWTEHTILVGKCIYNNYRLYTIFILTLYHTSSIHYVYNIYIYYIYKYKSHDIYVYTHTIYIYIYIHTYTPILYNYKQLLIASSPSPKPVNLNFFWTLPRLWEIQTLSIHRPCTGSCKS